jgi:hypothetical protein
MGLPYMKLILQPLKVLGTWDTWIQTRFKKMVRMSWLPSLISQDTRHYPQFFLGVAHSKGICLQNAGNCKVSVFNSEKMMINPLNLF